MKELMKIHPDDLVAVALKPLDKGRTVEVAGSMITLQEDIPQGHKVALVDIAEGQQVIKYGCSIGIAKENIPCGGRLLLQLQQQVG